MVNCLAEQPSPSGIIRVVDKRNDFLLRMFDEQVLRELRQSECAT